MALTRVPLWQNVVACGAVAVLLGLGTWQVQRKAWKMELVAERSARLVAAPAPLPAERVDPAAWSFRRVSIEGRFRHDLEQQLYGLRLEQGTPGYRVLTPLETAAGTVLVDRGWVPLERRDPAKRIEGQITGPVRVAGILRAPYAPGAFTPDNVPAKGAWYWIDLPALAQATGAPLREFYLEADDAPNPGGFPIGGQTRSELTDNHLAYAFIWYSLAGGCGVVFWLYRRRRSSEAS